MELKGNAVYFSKEPIDVENAIPLAEKESNGMLGAETSLSFTVQTSYISRKIIRWMILCDRRHSRFMKQIVLLKRNPKHHEAIFRCLRYGNKIPRKYQRKYKEVIKQMKMPWQR